MAGSFYNNSLGDWIALAFSNKHTLLLHGYALFLSVKLCQQVANNNNKGWRWLFHLFLILIIYLYYQSYTYGTYVFYAMLVYIHGGIPSPHLPVYKKAVIITGCDRGFGHALAIKLDQMGVRVFAGCLFNKGEGADALRNICSNQLHVLQLDVRDPDQVDAAFNAVVEKLNDYELWGLVNNAGICFIGNSEMISRDDSLKIMDVNFRGPYLMCTKFLPLLRRSQGRIVNVSSNAGLAPVPLMALYCSSKSALFMYTEVLRAENECFGIKVSAVIPSGYKTGIIAYDKARMAEKWWAEAPEIVKEDFGKKSFLIKSKATDSDEMLSTDISPVINAMIDGLLSTQPKPIYYKGFLARSIPFIYSHLPSPLREPVVGILTDWFEFQPICLQDIE